MTGSGEPERRPSGAAVASEPADSAASWAPPIDDPPELSDVAARLVAGDPAALGDLYRRAAPLVYTAALKALSDEAAAAEVTQQVFLGAWQRRAEHAAGRRPVTAWLMSIARTRIAERAAERSAHVRAAASHRFDAHAGGGAPEQIAHRIVDAVVAGDAIRRLEQPRREVLELSFFADRTHTEIAEDLGLSLETVQRGIKRALGQLSRQLRLSDGPS
jgi:RNA polymerase sigma-70 factor (ECF subfamily)